MRPGRSECADHDYGHDGTLARSLEHDEKDRHDEQRNDGVGEQAEAPGLGTERLDRERGDQHHQQHRVLVPAQDLRPWGCSGVHRSMVTRIWPPGNVHCTLPTAAATDCIIAR